jgi:hypothetical protein
MTQQQAAHRPLRPQWNCRSCGAQWPCAPAKEGLIEAYAHDRVGLLVYLAGLLVHAVQEVDGAPPHELLERFVCWAKCAGGASPLGGGNAGKTVA